MTSEGRWTLAADAAMVQCGGITYLAALPDGPIHILDGVSSQIVQLALAEASADVVAAVGAAYSKPPDEVAEAVHRLLDQLAGANLIEHDPRGA